ncbi:hypothetical protein VP1G_06746 [Cytospora mali]|uniref:Uncharacterized protein n=1 Tax=Cytospora mali TaxID=578113 RepID=A0A194V6C0_CYTMA|nr:hypothetical protein VP1G_06746 [Valsa mali var. pyri (nom. inval.)]
MSIFDARDLISWPGGDNSTDTDIGGIHFNLTALERWNYTLYSNNTLSNGSKCFLTFEPYVPKYVFANGTFINTTSCYSPINPLTARGYTSIGLAVVYGFCLMFTLICLGKHGRMYLPTEKRFRPVGRRWQWYWQIAMCATGFISLLTNIDVDRYYLPEIPIVLTSFFWFLMNLCTIACVWEAVRHWGSWQERQYVDPDPFALSMDDKRAKFEFFVPLFFYMWWWLDFFLVIPRNWGNIELQRSVEQTMVRAVPGATDNRFKSAAFILFMGWLTCAYHLRHSIKHYKERNRGIINRAVGLIKFTPYRFLLIIPISLFVVAFQAITVWKFEWSIMNVHGNRFSIFVGGYGPAVLIMLIQIIAGFINPNEDKELIRQRRMRGAENDRELGIVAKPAWWSRLNGDHTNESMRDRITRNVRELGGGRATAKNIDESVEVRTRNAEPSSGAGGIEMSQMRGTTSNAGGAGATRPGAGNVSFGMNDRRRSERTVETVAGLLFPNGGNAQAFTERVTYLSSDGPPPPYPEGQQHFQDRGRPRSDESTGGNNLSARPTTAGRSASANTTNSITSPPQQVKSMLDV